MSYISRRSPLADIPLYRSVRAPRPDAPVVVSAMSPSDGAGMTVIARVLEPSQANRNADGLKTLADRLLEIGAHCAALPDQDLRSPEDIIGYDESGMWT